MTTDIVLSDKFIYADCEGNLWRILGKVAGYFDDEYKIVACDSQGTIPDDACKETAFLFEIQEFTICGKVNHHPVPHT